MSIFSVQKCFSPFLAKVLGVFLTIFVEGVEEVLEDDALILQKSIGWILESLACLEGDQSTVETTALIFFFLTFALSAKFEESSLPWSMFMCVFGNLAAVVFKPQEVSRQ
jgi:hypothetical protein